jgi:general secretion pathway protein K
MNVMNYKIKMNITGLSRTGQDNQGAVALIMVVWVMVVLMAIVGEFTYSMRTEMNIVRNFKEEEQAYFLAMAGIEQAKLEILSVKESDLVFLDEEGVLVFKDDNEEEDEEEPLQRKSELGSGNFEYTITDEDSKLNINSHSLNTGKQIQNVASIQILKELFENAGIDSTEVDTIVDSLVDWRDENEEHHLNGAEEEYYQSLSQPYSCKDGPFDTIEELLLVKGMTPEILYGAKGEEDEESTEGVIKLLTVYDTGNININTASQMVLEVVLGIENAGNIIMQRETAPIPRPLSNGKVSSSYFTIVSKGTSADGIIKRTIKTVVHKTKKELETVYWNDNVI